MKGIAALTILFALLIVGCCAVVGACLTGRQVPRLSNFSPGKGPDPRVTNNIPSTDNDPETLKMVLLDYFEGIKNGDHGKMRSVTTDDFLIYEAGEIMNNDIVFKEMDRISPYKAEFNFEQFRVNVDGRLGHMSYHEHATFVVNDSVKVNLHFTGSAAFTKIGGTWKMYFLHGTRIDSLKLLAENK